MSQKDTKQYFFMLLGVYLVAYTALFRADFTYADDVRRKAFGYHGWLDFSRYINTFVSSILHADWYLSDISPLPQLIAVIILSLSGLMLICLFFDVSTKASLLEKILRVGAVAQLGLCPYFLGCISYKYDSPYMAFAIGISILPFMFSDSYGKKSHWRYEIISFICIIAMCSSYQSASGVYPMVALFYVAHLHTHKGKSIIDSLLFLLRSAVVYIAALLFFAVVLMRHENTELSHLGAGLIFTRYSTWFSCVLSDYKNSWLLLIILLIVLALVVQVFYSRLQLMYRLFIWLLVLLLAALLIFGALVVLQRDNYYPRSMIGIGVYLSLVSCIVISDRFHIIWLDRARYIYCLIPLALTWCFLIYSLTYGNCLAEQKRYTDMRLQLLLQDINEVECTMNGEINKIAVNGTLGLSPIVQRVAGDNSLLHELMVYNIPGEAPEGTIWFIEYFGLSRYELVSWDDHADNSQLVARRLFYDLYRSDDVLMIEWKKEAPAQR